MNRPPGSASRVAPTRLLAAWAMLVLFGFGAASARAEDLGLIKREYGDQGPVVLVLGGIQGDEPGGFHAATLLATRYQVTQGRLWVVPVLNPASMLRRHRGIHGDLNRKFAALARSDPDYDRVQAIKRLIGHPDVAVVINLHDGSGFYHPEPVDDQVNPSRWGQSLVIDSADTPVGKLRLLDWAEKIVGKANRHLAPLTELRVKNTRTAEGDRQMQKALTWYAINQDRLAIASEASKRLNLPQRVWSHLALVESVLRDRGVIFDRDFNLAESAIGRAMRRELGVRLGRGRICLPLDDVRPRLRGLPEAVALDQGFEAANPLLALRKVAGGYEIRYGNGRLSRLSTEPAALAPPVSLWAETAGRRLQLHSCGQLSVTGPVRLRVPQGYRVNAIGAGGRADQDRALRLADFDPDYSVDRAGRLFRLEIYRGQAFAGMAMLRFDGDPEAEPRVSDTVAGVPRSAAAPHRPETL